MIEGLPLQVQQLRQAVRNLKSEQNRLTGELEREREERARLVLLITVLKSSVNFNSR